MAESSKSNALIIHHSSSSKGGWQAAIFIIFVEFAERFAYQGLAGNLISYLTNVLGEPITTAAKNVNTWVGVSSLFPLLGGFVADSYLGRFNTILLSSLIYLLGMVFLTLSVSVMKHTTLFFLALYILSVGDGGHKPCVQTFAADQFDDDTPEEKDAKSSFFNWWYLGVVAGSTAAVFVVIYLQDNVGWAVGLGVLAGVLALALALFLLGIKRYRKEGPTGSPFTRMAQVFVAASRKWRVNVTRDPHNYCYGDEEDDAPHLHAQPKFHTLAHTNQFRFLEKAMIIDDIDASSKTRNPWRLCSVTQVEEVKLVLRLIPIWLSCLMFTVVQSQLHTFFTKQGGTMNRSIGPHFQIPPASLQGLVGITILFAVPIYDRVFVPLARKLTGHPSGITVLQRIGIGLFLSIINMIVSALVETKRVGIAREYDLIDNPKAVLPMTIWWLLPQYMITGVSDAFTIVGLQELFYDQMPESMRSLGAAAYISIVGVGSFVSNAVIVAVEEISSKAGEKWLGDNLNRAHLDDFYWVLAVLSALSLCVYLWLAKSFVYKKVDGAETSNHQGSSLNKLPDGMIVSDDEFFEAIPFKFPIQSGIGPNRLLLPRSKICNLESWHNWEGSTPWKEFLERYNSLRFKSSLSKKSGKTPSKLLSSRSNTLPLATIMAFPRGKPITGGSIFKACFELQKSLPLMSLINLLTRALLLQWLSTKIWVANPIPVNLDMLFGIVPERWFWEKSMASSDFMSPILSGISPNK
ncbi:protein NRT1/ PTR FAMILY 5.4 [Senna tora]|uniref:Protein NRT1/ PTR FAMILY 5.4 n=1 Tax=Senna tora TaxID=362788 RepID=A0A834WJ50_9FABA|nr:protein NRT1/ PTR FAMILY 5.4 [Senna tora]